jgi:hypothetical protein
MSPDRPSPENPEPPDPFDELDEDSDSCGLLLAVILALAFILWLVLR